MLLYPNANIYRVCEQNTSCSTQHIHVSTVSRQEKPCLKDVFTQASGSTGVQVDLSQRHTPLSHLQPFQPACLNWHLCWPDMWPHAHYCMFIHGCNSWHMQKYTSGHALRDNHSKLGTQRCSTAGYGGHRMQQKCTWAAKPAAGYTTDEVPMVTNRSQLSRAE